MQEVGIDLPTKKPKALCYGCREATNLTESECVLGFPIKDLDAIVTSLRKLNEKAIPRVKRKAIYRALLSRG